MDQANDRQREQSSLLRLVVEEKFYRPAVIRPAGHDVNRNAPVLPAETLSDVQDFDEKIDAAQMKDQAAAGKVIEAGLAELLREENEYRSKRGAPPVPGPAE